MRDLENDLDNFGKKFDRKIIFAMQRLPVKINKSKHIELSYEFEDKERHCFNQSEQLLRFWTTLFLATFFTSLSSKLSSRGKEKFHQPQRTTIEILDNTFPGNSLSSKLSSRGKEKCLQPKRTTIEILDNTFLPKVFVTHQVCS